MDLDATVNRWPRTLLQVAFFLGVMACGYLILYIGLPPPRSDPVPDSPDPSAELMKRLTDGVHVEPGRWQMIVIHHSATAGGNAARFHDYHYYELGWEGGLGYHFVVGNGNGSGDGEIEIGWRWPAQEQGAHVRGHNVGAIGICLVGNFEDRPPTRAQVQALVRLVRGVMGLCGLAASDVRLHRELAPTACPGRHFPTDAFRAALTAPAVPD